MRAWKQGPPAQAADPAAVRDAFAATFGLLPVAVRLADCEGRLVRVNGAFARMAGRSAQELEGVSYLEFTHPEDMDATLRPIQRLIDGEADEIEFEKRRVLDGGAVQHVSIHLAAVRDARGALVYTIGTVQDMTPAREAEAALHRRDAVMRAVTAAAQRILADRASSDWLETLARELADGVEAGAVALLRVGRRAGEQPELLVLHERAGEPCDPQAVAAALGELAAAAGLDAICADCCSARLSECAPAERAVLEAIGARSVVGVPVSLGERARGLALVAERGYERAWADAEVDALRLAAALIGDGWAYSESAAALAVRDRLLAAVATLGVELLGAGAEAGRRPEVLEALREAVGGEALVLLRPAAGGDGAEVVALTQAPGSPAGRAGELAEAARAAWDCRAGGGRDARGSGQVLLADAEEADDGPLTLAAVGEGDRAWSPGEADALRIAAGLLGSARRRAAMEAELRARDHMIAEAQKREAVARLTAGVAHDFSNALVVSRAHAAALSESHEPGVADAARHILDSLDHSGRLVRRLLSFSRSGTARLQDVDVPAAVRAALELLRPAVPADVQLALDLAEGLPPVHIDPVQLEQVVANLVMNALDAVRGGGRIEVAVRGGDGQVELEVADNGEGMEPAVLARAREPFFTTRQAEGHSGIGLATVDTIVRDAGGTLALASEPRRRTAAVVQLPARAERDPEPAPAAAPAAPAAAPAEAAAPARLLVVDDNEAVRGSLARYLRWLGYEVEATGEVAEALAVLDDPEERVSLLLSDVVMPEMSGLELARLARAARPGLDVVLMTGYTEEEVLRRGSLEPGIALYPKDRPIEDIVELLERVLAQPR